MREATNMSGRTPDARPAFRGDAQGAAAVEFALVAAPFLALIFCIIQVSLDFLFFSQFDYATHKAAQSIRSGEVQRQGMTADQFRTNLLCSQLSLVNCDSVQVNVRRVRTKADWLAADPDLATQGQTLWCPSGSSELVLVQTFMPVPFLSALWSGDPASTGPRLYKSVVALRNDPFGLSAPAGPGC
jgi:Flp pilus assembly protein TadG